VANDVVLLLLIQLDAVVVLFGTQFQAIVVAL
jgi:hypothetical protein